MKKFIVFDWGIMLSILLIVLSAALLTHSLVTGDIDENYLSGLSSKNLDIQAYFFPSHESYDATLTILNKTQDTIHCAFRSLNDEGVEKVLTELEGSGKTVRLIVDYDYIGNDNIKRPYVRFTSENAAMMHNNFCIIDQKVVMTGSILFNGNTIDANIHDVIFIDNEKLAQQYNKAFWILYQNQSRANLPKALSVKMEQGKAKAVFCPSQDCLDILVDLIDQAQDRIYFATYTLTHPRIIEAIKQAQNRSVKIKGLVDANGYKFSQESIADSNIDGVKIYTELNRVHTKILIIDNFVVTGSLNPSLTGIEHNDENLLILENSTVLPAYEAFFDLLYYK